jgi:hypothetical protein
MDAVYTGINWSARRFATLVAAVLLAALFVGGLSGYLIRGGGSTGASTLSSAVSAPALSGPFTESHDSTAGFAAPAGLTEPRDASTGSSAPAAAGLTEPHDGVTGAASAAASGWHAQ